jgi:hypothetical protein
MLQLDVLAMKVHALVFTLLVVASTLEAADLRGKVVNQSTGEPLGKVAVMLTGTPYMTTTSADGQFKLSQIPAGKYVLRVEVVGYWLQRVPVEISAEDVKEFAISLTPQGARRTDKVEVTADVFGGSEPAEVAQFNLTTSELKQTDTVFGGDVFRSAQTLPGVTGQSNNDFFAQFTVLGAPFSEVGVYVDGVLVRQPFHGISDNAEGASIGIMNDDTISTVSLTPLGYSERYGEATAGALDIETREGSREKTHVAVGVGMAESHVTAEGGLPRKQGSWLVSGRKSYLGYLTRHSAGVSTTVEPSFADLTTRLTYDLTPRQTMDFLAVGGRSQIDNSETAPLNPNEFFTGSSNFSLVRMGWRAGITPNLLLSTHAAFTSQAELTQDQQKQPLERRTGSEWLGGSSVNWNWKAKQALEAGWTVRRLSGRTVSHYYTGDQESPDHFYPWSGTGMRQGGYVQQSSSLWKGRLQIMGGVRWDHFSKAEIHPLSPQLSGSLRVASATNLVWGMGRYRQFPEVQYASLPCGGMATLVTTSNHFLAGIEQRIGDNTRIRVQGFDRAERAKRGLRGGYEAWSALVQGSQLSSCGGIRSDERFLGPNPSSSTHGVQFIVQRRSSNRLSGWLSYTLLHQNSKLYTGTYGGSQWDVFTYEGFGDQRHSFNAFGMYRLTPTLNLSGKFLYGSGYPVGNGGDGGKVYLNGQVLDWVPRNPFLRFDLRADKAFTVRHQRVTLHGEILNVTNHRNLRIFGYRIQEVGGKWDYYTTEGRTLGFTPTVGIELHF